MKQLSKGLIDHLKGSGFKIMTYPAKSRIDVILGNEGIEIDNEGIRVFTGSNDGFDRMYTPSKNEKIKTALAVIRVERDNNSMGNIADTEPEQQGSTLLVIEKIKTALAEIRVERDNNSMGKPADTEPEQQGSTLLVIPELITNDVIESHQGAIRTLLMMQTTDKTYIKERKLTQTKTIKYVDGSYMTRCLNLAFLFDWSFEVPETRQDEDQFTALGVLTANVDGHTVTKSQWGSQRVNKGMELGDALKGATTDALKKCASLFGIAADVYAGEV